MRSAHVPPHAPKEEHTCAIGKGICRTTMYDYMLAGLLLRRKCSAVVRSSVHKSSIKDDAGLETKFDLYWFHSADGCDRIGL